MTTEWLPAVSADYDRDLELAADVVVIGTGAGGAVLASELAEGGRSVIMLEKGGYHTRKDFNQQERDMFPKLFEDAGARTTADGGMMVLHASTVGGSTVVNWAICFDPPARVLESWATDHGVEAIRLADLKPSLDKVRFVLNVRKLLPEEVNRNGQILLEGAAKLGMRGDRFEHNRTQCVRSGFCILGCAYDRKQTMLVTYVPRALHFGAKLYPNAEVSAFEQDGDRITAVTGTLTNPKTGRRFKLTARAKVFSVSGGAVSTPRLLLNAGLANESGQLGQNLALHPTTAAVAVFDDPVKGYEGIHFGTYVSDLEHEGILIESVFAYPGLLGSAMFRWGDGARQAMQRYDHLAAAIVLVHDEGRGRVAVDGHGLPVLDYWVSPADQAKLKKGLAALAKIYFAAGARQVLIPHADGLTLTHPDQIPQIEALAFEPNRVAVFSAHQMGTAAMGGDPRSSVTDSWGRCHAYQNLFVCDGSVFPTSLGVNPQITIAALADRAARHMLSEHVRYFGLS